MVDWDKLRVFHAVVKAGSFTKATKILHISQSAISRQVNILETELGTPLFIRKPRELALTEAGKDLNVTVVKVSAKLDMTQAAISELKQSTQGHLQVATTITLGALWLAPRLQEFLDQYPEIRLNLLLKEEETEINLREADIGITTLLGNNTDVVYSTPIACPLHLYASRDYLKTHGTPQTARDLDKHHLILLGKERPYLYSNSDWLLTVGAKTVRTPYLLINGAQAVCEAVRGGLGIAALHRYVVGDDPEIVEVLPDLPKPPISQCIVYPSHLAGLKRVEVFVRFIMNKMKEGF